MKKITIMIGIVILAANAWSQKYELNSPDKQLTIVVEIANSSIAVKLQKGSELILSLADLSMEAQSQVYDLANRQVKNISRKTVNEIIQPVIREKSDSYKNSYNELTVVFKSNSSITFRLFDEGLAYRFSTFAKDSLLIEKENISIQFQEGDSIRFQASKTFNSSYETPYEHNSVAGIPSGRLCNLPVMIEKKNGPFVMITESDLYDYPGLWITGTGTSTLKTTNPPVPKKLNSIGSIYDQGQVAEQYDHIARVKGTRSFPWRLFAIADHEEQLITNNMVYLLASPTQLTDVSWIKPGVVMFDWWAKNNIYGVNFKTGVNTETAKYFIDFCAAHGLRYFLFDDGWSPKEDLLHESNGLNMAEVTAYAKTKSVDILLWVIWTSLEKQMDEAFDKFQRWGIKGIKMDFMNRDDQSMVSFYEKVASKAVEKKMVVNFHGAYKPCGLSRKYPNVLTREALIEFEYNGWTTYDNPEHHNILPYIRMFTGPMDYIPGTMRNSTKENFRMLGDYPMGQGTRAHSMALFVILNSPMTMLPDSPSDYDREKECTDFLAKIPVEWDDTRLLKGKISKYTVLARRAGKQWFVGAITNQDERTLEMATDFLPGGNYQIEMIEDGINANSRAEDYKKTITKFSAGKVFTLNLAQGGGWVARITPSN